MYNTIFSTPVTEMKDSENFIVYNFQESFFLKNLTEFKNYCKLNQLYAWFSAKFVELI